MVPGHYKKRQGQTINIPTDQNLATLNYPKGLEYKTILNPTPNRSVFHSKMSEKYSRNRDVLVQTGMIRFQSEHPCSRTIRKIKKSRF